MKPFPSKPGRFLDALIEHRYLIALIAFIALTLLRIHGSSLSFYDDIFDDGVTSPGLLLGIPKSCRTDEYCVQLGYYFSQKYNAFRETSHLLSLAGQDMILGYNSPVLDPTLVGKPFVWGYFSGDNALGLSWYWCSKTILGLLAAFEMVGILTGNRRLALFGSLLLIFSPTVQWWFAPHIYDAIFWSMAIFDVGYLYFTADTRKSRILTSCLAVSAPVGFVTALFPSLQISCGLLVLFLLAAALVRDREAISFRRRDLARTLLIAAVVLAILLHFLYHARDAIRLLMNTVYPGKRIVCGGGAHFSDLFTNFNMVFTPFWKSYPNNPCELSTFNHFGVLCLILFPYLVFVIARKADGQRRFLLPGTVFFAASLVEIEFLLIGFPVWLAKITLFSYVNRMDITYGFTAALFTLWTINAVVRYRDLLDRRILAAAGIFFAACIARASTNMIEPFLRDTLLGIYPVLMKLILLFFILEGFFLLFGRQRIFISLFLGWIALSSFTVNPLMQGTAPLTDRPVIREAKAIHEEEDGYWLSLETLFQQNAFLAAGIPMLNATSFYPDMEKWAILDPTGEHSDVYNRYGHVIVDLTDGEAAFDNPSPDSIHASIPPEKLRELCVRFLVSKDDVSDILRGADISFDILYRKDGCIIYRLD